MITIYNNKIIYTSHRNKKTKVADHDLFKFLGEYVKLDEKTTFKRIMELLKVNEALTDVVFAHTLGNYPFDLFYQDFLIPLPAAEMKEHYDVKNQFLEVYYYPDIFKYDKNERFEWSDALDIHLIQIGKKENTPYGIMFSKLGAFQKHKIKIKYEVDIIPHDSTKKITKKSLITPLIKARLDGMKLFDFLWAILYEISWMGAPTRRDAESKRLSEMEYDIKEGNVKTSEFTTLEAIKKVLKKKPKKKLAKKRK